MQPKSLGATAAPNDLISPWWHRALSEKQLAAYIRYQYLRLSSGDPDWDSTAHIKKLTRWDGGRDSTGVNHSAIWPKIAECVIRCEAHPAAWVCAHFSPWAQSYLSRGDTKFVARTPSILKKAWSPDLYAEYATRQPERLTQELHTATTTMRYRLKSLLAVITNTDARTLYVLCDESEVIASPFFRHFFAVRFNCGAAVDRYFAAAAADYEARQPFYDAALAAPLVGEIDKQIKNRVMDIRSHWSGYCE